LKSVEAIFIDRAATIRDAAATLDRTSVGIVLAVDAGYILLGTVTDGDIRRAVLADWSLSRSVGELLAHKASLPNYRVPLALPIGTPREELLVAMQEHAVRHVPLVDKTNRVIDLVTLQELLPDEVPRRAVIMAGGFGKRLQPLTNDLPKPMLPVAGRPLLELTIEQLRDAGIKHINLTTHFQADKIRDHFGNGDAFGVEINYVNEEQPLGTAGALHLIKATEEPLLILNGDILTKVDFRAMHDFHTEHHADLTVAVREYDFQVPYGVIESQDGRVTKVSEKPVYSFFVNAGIYLLQPSAHRFIPQDERFDMTDLIQHLVAAGRPVVSFPVVEYWLDIGHHADYERAQEDVKSGKFDS
jgi:dTDP-glucose pyrophosphorylase/CBS domain-containing protein